MVQGNAFLAQDKKQPIIVGHRGLPLLHQENTLAGFRRAHALGVAAVELDVRLTSDGQAVVCHDEDLLRLTGQPGRLSRLSWDALASRRIQKRLSMGVDHQGQQVVVDYETEERIPLLREVLEELGTKLLFNIELKMDTPTWRTEVGSVTAKEVARLGLQERAIITSFDLRKLRAARRRAPGLSLGFCFDDGMLAPFGPLQTWLGQRRSKAFLQHALRKHWSALFGSTRVVGIEHTLLTAPEVKSMRQRGLAVGSYTLFPVGSTTGKAISARASEPAELGRLLALGIDWIETDDPVRALELIG